MRRSRLYFPALLALLATSIGTAFASASAVPRPEDAAVVQPLRVLDTRIGVGAPTGIVTAGQVIAVAVPTASGAGASSVLLNITATDATANGWVKAWPCGEAVPATSALNFTPGRTAANAVAVKLAPAGVCLATNVAVHLIADLQGWTTGTTDFIGTTPSRLLDTRETKNPLRAGQERALDVAGQAGIGANAAFAALNLTIENPAQAGWVVAYPCGQPTNGSTVNFSAGETVANLTLVALSGARVCIKSLVDVHLVVDAYGWSAGGGRLKVQSPSRLLDTRDPSWPAGQSSSLSTVRLRVAGRAGVPNDADSAVITVTVVNPQGDGFVTVWPCDQTLPTASTINTWPNALRSNLSFVKLSQTDGTACLYYKSANGTPTDLVVDAVGWTTGGPTRTTPTGVGSLQLAGSSGCVFSKADKPTNVAFCDTFDAPTPNSATRSGDLDATVWGVSRTNTIGIDTNAWLPARLTGCGATQTVQPPNDVKICNGRVYEAVTDGGGQPTLAMYPKQPFDIAGRTGTVVFDVSADSQGPHAAWPEFWWTDQPVPAPHARLPSQTPYAQNSFGFTLDDDTCGANATTVYAMMSTTNYRVAEIPFTKTGCVTKGSATGALNHFEVRISQNRVEVWAADAGSTAVRQIAFADVAMPLTRGVIWIEDVHYNADKFNTQGNHTFAWDNVGFDGPTPYRDLTFDVQDALTPGANGAVDLAYTVNNTPIAVTAPGVYWLQTPTKSYVGFNWFAKQAFVPSVRVNGGPWHDTAWPFDSETFAWRTIAIPVPMSEIRTGNNTIEFKIAGSDPAATSNINIILIAASPVP